jgi:hypothetical protein
LENTSLKIFLSRTCKPVLINRGTIHLSMKGIQVCSNKGPHCIQRGDNQTNAKIGWDHLKVFVLRTIGPEKLRFS